jgi:diguanylate cyclase (GGDEF)-like protein
LWIAVLGTAVLTFACLALPRSLVVVAISDLVGGLLMLCAFFSFTHNARHSSGRMRWFWMLQATGWAFWFSDQVFWIVFDLILHKKMPAMYPSDALLFLAGAPMIAGVLLRPHRPTSERSASLGILDFLLLSLWWGYLYVSFIVCWQYVSLSEDAYNVNFDVLSWAQTLLLAGALFVFWRQSSGAWRKFYAVFAGAVVFNGVAFYVLNHAIELNVYYTGSWYDIPYSGSFALFSAVALYGQDLTPAPARDGEDSYSAAMANLAMLAVLSLPIIAIYAMLDPRLPPRAANFRVIVTLATMFLMAFVLFIQHRRLNRELWRTNVVLQEASLTDPLTGLRNRRYFSATIDADVEQTLRSHADNHDPHTRDLVFYLIDADHFKDVNDQYGHDMGDKVLVEMAHRLSSSIRHSDVLVRWGGEEFLVVSRYTDRAEAELLAQRVLSAIADVPFSIGNSGQTIYRTCSLGWAAFPWFVDNPRSVRYEEVLTLADRALNRAKQSGRNRAVGMLPARGKPAADVTAGAPSPKLLVDELAIAGPHHQT